jgi:hypothetical protein
MRFGAINLKQLVLALVCSTLLIGATSTAYGQDWHDQRRAERREFHQRERTERRGFRTDMRNQRLVYGNNPYWRARARGERTAFRREERAERIEFRHRTNPGRHLGRGYYYAPGQRLYVIRNGRRVYYRR